jgi:16S rRNA (adenine1518-N6/adenine1519-N6)-dimethyltransferase
MSPLSPKKSLGQHFLEDKAIALKITSFLECDNCNSVLEIGPGKGILTQFLLEKNLADLRIIEIDNECIKYLQKRFPGLNNIISGDFLKLDLDFVFDGNIAVIGNFPYNISSQILFRILDYRQKVTEVVGMLQKEVAERICSGPGSKVYGILSVLIGAFYETEYLFTVPNTMFNPKPKVQSGVIRLKRNYVSELDCDERLFFRVVKACFNQRRKMLRNSIKSAFGIDSSDYYQLSKRPEQLSVDQFIELTLWIQEMLM